MDPIISAAVIENGRQPKPCAACKYLRRKCRGKECLLAPCFPPNDPEKFLLVHRVFGAGNIIRLLQSVEDDQKEDTVNSYVYEARMRIRDPVYGCAGVIYNLQLYIRNLQTQLAYCQAQLHVLQSSAELHVLQNFQDPRLQLQGYLRF